MNDVSSMALALVALLTGPGAVLFLEAARREFVRGRYRPTLLWCIIGTVMLLIALTCAFFVLAAGSGRI